jgi:hypothetical protein
MFAGHLAGADPAGTDLNAAGEHPKIGLAVVRLVIVGDDFNLGADRKRLDLPL